MNNYPTFTHSQPTVQLSISWKVAFSLVNIFFEGKDATWDIATCSSRFAQLRCNYCYCYKKRKMHKNKNANKKIRWFPNIWETYSKKDQKYPRSYNERWPSILLFCLVTIKLTSRNSMRNFPRRKLRVSQAMD